MKRLERLTALLSHLQSRRYTRITDLEEKFQISERTVFRDIRALEEAGVPVAFEKDKGYFILDRHFLPPLSFTIEEAKSFIFVEQLARKYMDVETFGQLSSALEKVRNKLTDGQLKDVESLQSKVLAYIDPNYSTRFLQQAEQACEHKSILKIHYKDINGKETRRSIEPIGITFYSQSWHIIAYCCLRNDYRDFSLSRVLSLEPTGEVAQREHLTLHQYVKKITETQND